jgi:DNA polymerase III subunit gamma/tau
MVGVPSGIITDIASHKIRKTIFISGPPGAGKTTLARIIAQTFLCLEPKEDGTPCFECASCKCFHANGVSSSQPDYTEDSMAVDTGVDHSRQLVSLAKAHPMLSQYRAFVLDEAQKLTEAAKHALLKLLEEPPKNAVIILCTMSPEAFSDKLGKAIRDRCLRVEMQKPKKAELVKRLHTICVGEKANVTPAVLSEIVEASDYIPRECVANLETVLSSGKFEVAAAEAKAFVSNLVGQSPFTLAKKALGAIYSRDLPAFVEAVSSSSNPGFLFKTLIEQNANVIRVRHFPDTIVNQYARASALELSRHKLTDNTLGNIGKKLQEAYLPTASYQLDASHALIHFAAALWPSK